MRNILEENQVQQYKDNIELKIKKSSKKEDKIHEVNDIFYQLIENDKIY